MNIFSLVYRHGQAAINFSTQRKTCQHREKLKVGRKAVGKTLGIVEVQLRSHETLRNVTAQWYRWVLRKAPRMCPHLAKERCPLLM